MFDHALDRIEEVFEFGKPWETLHSEISSGDLFLMPVNDEWFPEFQRTVDNPFEVTEASPPDELQSHDEIRIWGTRGGDRNAETFDSLSENDIVLYYRNGAIIAGGRVHQKFHGEEYGDYIWDNPGSEFVYTLKEYTRLGIPKEELWEKLGYEDNFSPQGFSRVYPDRTDQIRPLEGDLWDVFKPYVVAKLPNGASDIQAASTGFSLEEWRQESLSGDYEYFILKTGDEAYEDEPSEAYHFREAIPGSRQLRDAAENCRFIYLEDGEFYAVGSIEGIDSEDRDGTEHFFAQIDDFHPIPPIPREDVELELSIEFPIQYGIINIDQSDFEKILGTTAWNMMEAIEDLLEEEAGQAWLYRDALAHLVAGKNIVFYGPPGTGKTRAARKLSRAICGTDFSLVTANAEWSNYQVIGGYAPANGGFEPQPGFLTQAAQDCRQTLSQAAGSHPSWLLIDELNRANLDEAFGDVFTLLDIDYRTTRDISYAPTAESVPLPLSFRILATMNTYDQAQLFSLGYAFRRRFAFVRVPSLMVDGSQTLAASDPSADPTQEELTPGAETTISVIRSSMIDGLLLGANDQHGVSAMDVSVVIPDLAEASRIQDAVELLNNSDALRTGSLDWLETIVYFAQEIMERNVIDIGQAILIDAAKFVVAHQLLFPENTDRRVLDQAIVSYVVPQFEHFMPALRRAETIDQESTAIEDFEEIIDLAGSLGLPETVSALTRAKNEKRVLE